MQKTVRVYGFPPMVLADAVKDFIEQYTGKGTVDAVDVYGAKVGDQRTSVKVQFTTPKAAEILLTLTKGRQLWCGNSYLSAWEAAVDVVAPRMFLHGMDDVTLYLGCQLSEEEFSVLWDCENVSVKFGLEMKTLYFFLSHRSVQYKLELSYENIWQIELHQPCRQGNKFLLIQLLGAPLVYEEEMSEFHYFKEAYDGHWVRDVDFTPSQSIGQSSALCLELPGAAYLPDLKEYFAFYKESRERFSLEEGYSFSGASNPHLVPIVDMPGNIDLPYKIVFKINSLVQHGYVPGPKVDDHFLQMVDPNRVPIKYIEHALEKLHHLKECCYEPVQWLREEYARYCLPGEEPAFPGISLRSGLVYTYRVQVTPSKVYCCGPEVNLSNDVVRRFAFEVDNFLRVNFVDEELQKLPSSSLSNRKQTRIYDRILSVLRDGIVIGDKKFEFLAFSSSQLRENSVWMFASSPGLTASDIRSWMGDFREIRIVAKYAARLGQSLSSSRETMKVAQNQIEKISDVETETGGVNYVFSDGIGKISAELAKDVARKCGIDAFVPSAFQIRYAGYKGVVAVDPASLTKLSLRKSMLKFESENTNLNVVSWSNCQRCFLNRQVIVLLSTLGVEDTVFLKKQREAVAQLDGVLNDPLKAKEALELIPAGEYTFILKELLNSGYLPDEEPFLSMMLQSFRASKLFDLRVKSKIFIQQGRAMMGCLDETGTLDYGEVFVQITESKTRRLHGVSDSIEVQGLRRGDIVEGKVAVSKNPCLHPGDLRILNAVNVPALHHMTDCIVFPQKGRRPHPNECSGSDLDGDVYFVCWDPELIPPKQVKPMAYLPARPQVLDHDVTIEEVKQYFVDYIVNDNMGIISNAHMILADKEPLKALSDSCLELARLFSIAVDFPKTGIFAKIPHRLRSRECPDFMENTNKPAYESQQVIGQLFREVKDIASSSCDIISFTKEAAKRAYDQDMDVEGYTKYIDEAMIYKRRYDFKLGNLMDDYGIKTEAEILTGNIARVSKSFDRRRDVEGIGHAVRALKKEARNWFYEKRESMYDISYDPYARASAWYHVTYHPNYWGLHKGGLERDHFLSFPWVVHDKLIEIKKKKMSARRSTSFMPSIRDQQLFREIEIGD